MLLTAGLALPMDGRPPIRDAAVLIEGARIAAVGTRREVLARPDAAGHERRDFGDAVLLPGLVNAHIHLEYTHLGPLPAPRPFLPWIRSLVAWSAERAPADSELANLFFELADIEWKHKTDLQAEYDAAASPDSFLNDL